MLAVGVKKKHGNNLKALLNCGGPEMYQVSMSFLTRVGNNGVL